MGPLATAETSLIKLLANADGKEGVDTAAVALCKKNLTTITAWGQQCRAAVNAQERNKGQAAQEAQEHLEDLKQTAEGQKAVKASMPKAAAAPKKRSDMLASLRAIPQASHRHPRDAEPKLHREKRRDV